ncbi:MAG: hypothetical protein HRT64_05590 [Erythrobacter sp.]|nr:hypothetical protein [Erythrobacter sp.]
MQSKIEFSLIASSQSGVARGYVWQIARDFNQAEFDAGPSLLLQAPMYEFLVPALRAALAPAGWNDEHSYGVFRIPQISLRPLAGAIAKLHPNSLSPFGLHVNEAAPSPTRLDLREARDGVVQFLLQSARLRQCVTILGV